MCWSARPPRLIARAAWTVKGAFALGGQDCHAEASGAFTGDISAEMLQGRRRLRRDRRPFRAPPVSWRDATPMSPPRREAAWRAGLTRHHLHRRNRRPSATPARPSTSATARSPAACPSGATAANTAIAYEPVWAIGTGKTPTDDDIAAMHAHIRALPGRTSGRGGQGMRILYGGSVKPSNAKEILGAGRCRRRAGGRRQPESRGFSGDYRGAAPALTRSFRPFFNSAPRHSAANKASGGGHGASQL